LKNSNDSNPKSAAPAAGLTQPDDVPLTVAEQKLAAWFPEIAEPVRVKMLVFLSELVKAAKTAPLLSGIQTKSPESTCLADSIYASKLIFEKLIPNQPLVEFGSGNGLPGLVFAILYPQVKVVTLEKDARKLEFCKTTGTVLGLSNYLAQAAGIEEVPDRSVFNLVARGLTPLHKSLLTTRKPVPKGGRFFQMRGDGWANELASVPSQLFSFWNPNLLGTYKLPETTHEMAVLMMDKSAD
jgi:16S rRNA (guanine527-N7)-methyltransferase